MLEDIYIDFDNVDDMRKALKPLKMKKHLGQYSEKIYPSKDKKSIIVRGTSLEQVTRAMEIYSRDPHGKLGNHRIRVDEDSKEKRIRREVEKEFDVKYRKILEEKQRNEQKWSKERTKYRDDIQKMRTREKEAEQRITYLEENMGDVESALESSEIDFIEERLEKQDIESELAKRDAEVEEYVSKFEEYKNRSFYKVIWEAMKDLVSSK